MHAQGLLELFLMLWLDYWSIHVSHHQWSLLDLLHLPTLCLFLHEIVKVDSSIHLVLETGNSLLTIWIGSQCSALAATLDWLDYLPVKEERITVVLLC